MGAPTHTFSIGFDVPGYDEMEYARVAAQHFGCEHHEYYVTPADVVDAVPKIASWYDQPFGNASAVPAYYCDASHASTASIACWPATAVTSYLAATSAMRSSTCSVFISMCPRGCVVA